QLATCPHCASDFLLPAFDQGVTQGTCPECERLFSVAEVDSRVVEEARPLGRDERLVSRQTLPSFSGTTLASFLKEAEQRSRPLSGDPEPTLQDDLSAHSRATWNDASLVEEPSQSEATPTEESDPSVEIGFTPSSSDPGDEESEPDAS